MLMEDNLTKIQLDIIHGEKILWLDIVILKFVPNVQKKTLFRK